MSDRVFGLDFGTTNSLAAVVVGDEVQALTSEADDKPHPSVVWYRGSEIVVGREARQHIESFEGGGALGFVRSPKMTLRREGLVHIGGRALDPADVVAEVLCHVRGDAARRRRQPYAIDRAVMTVPVDFAGPQRRQLRSAARKAGISVLQFVHEPAAALYAYIRAKREIGRELAQLENRVVLVFDWGGGTLDLTVCRVLGGVVMQIANRGNNDIGGDVFDERLRNFVRDKYAAQHQISDVSAKEQPGAEAKLLTQCELAKIKLSDRSEFTVIAKDYIKGGSKQRDLAVKISRREFEDLSADLVDRGLAEIDRLLEDVRLSRSDIELCIATGGMINVPAIWNGLIERFGARVPVLPNRDRIIAEGAAWIAHDGLRLTLAKPIEVLVADRTGRGTYVPLVAGGLRLPVENEILPAENRRFFCIDPRDGVAAFQFAKPRKVGLLQPTDERTILASLSLPIDPFARPFLERLECMVQIDHDYIGHVLIKSNGREESVAAEFHDLDFGLALPLGSGPRMPDLEAEEHGEAQKDGQPTGHRRNSNVALRSNVAERENWQLVPGDLVQNWKPEFFDRRSVNATEFQISEKLYYVPCARCGRTIYKINAEGPVEACHRYGCSEVARSSTNYQG